MRCAALLSVLAAIPCSAQTGAGNAQTSGRCSPAIVGNNNNVYLDCSNGRPKTTAPTMQFAISDPGSMMNLTQSLGTKGSGNWWVTYESAYGKTASPVALAQFVSITNTRATPQTVQTYEVSLHTDRCGWIELVPIPARDVEIWWTYAGLDSAILNDFSKSMLDSILSNPIPPYGTVSGWWFLDSPIKCDLREGENVRYRFKLKTFVGSPFVHTTREFPINNKPMHPDRSGRTTQILLVPIRKDDISGFYRRIYSSPIPADAAPAGHSQQ
jgi:hypothetical protein